MTYDLNKEEEKIEDKRFALIKDLTILSGSVFGLSIALASGNPVNLRFIFGEFFLFLAMLSGIILLYSALHGEEFMYFLMTSSHLKSTLPKKTGGPEDFLVEEQQKLARQYEKLLEKNKKNFLSILFKIIKVDYFYPFFYITFVSGVFLIFLSLINFQNFFLN